MLISRSTVVAFGLLVLTVLSSFVLGGTPQGPCTADIQKFCPNVKPGLGAIAKCLQEHKTQLSPTCRAEGEKLKEKIEEVKHACAADADKFCKGAPSGPGAKYLCLKQHVPELSPACKKEFPAAPASSK